MRIHVGAGATGQSGFFFPFPNVDVPLSRHHCWEGHSSPTGWTRSLPTIGPLSRGGLFPGPLICPPGPFVPSFANLSCPWVPCREVPVLHSLLVSGTGTVADGTSSMVSTCEPSFTPCALHGKYRGFCPGRAHLDRTPDTWLLGCGTLDPPNPVKSTDLGACVGDQRSKVRAARGSASPNSYPDVIQVHVTRAQVASVGPERVHPLEQS